MVKSVQSPFHSRALVHSVRRRFHLQATIWNESTIALRSTDWEKFVPHLLATDGMDVDHAKKVSTITSRPWTLTYPHNMTHCTHAISWQTAIKVQVSFYLAVMFNLFCLFWRNIPRTKQNHMVARSEKCHGCNLQNLLPHTLQGGCPERLQNALSFSCTSNSSSWKQ